jgi:hypothetical protein
VTAKAYVISIVRFYLQMRCLLSSAGRRFRRTCRLKKGPARFFCVVGIRPWLYPDLRAEYSEHKYQHLQESLEAPEGPPKYLAPPTRFRKLMNQSIHLRQFRSLPPHFCRHLHLKTTLFPIIRRNDNDDVRWRSQ